MHIYPPSYKPTLWYKGRAETKKKYDWKVKQIIRIMAFAHRISMGQTTTKHTKKVELTWKSNSIKMHIHLLNEGALKSSTENATNKFFFTSLL